MSSPPLPRNSAALTRITKQELFARLAQGRAAGVTVVTPNRRLAQVLKLEFDAFQAGKNLPAWEDADILPLDAFAMRCHEEAAYSQDAAAGGGLPMLLSEAQSRALWEEAIRGSRWNGVLLDVPQTAASAQEAWRLAQAWRIAGALEKFALSEDTQAFAEWARVYGQRLKKDGFIDVPLLLDFSLKSDTKLLVAYAFDILPPQTRDVFARFDWVACAAEKKNSIPRKTSFASPAEELEAAARWARARLEEGMASGRSPRIGVVVPDLKLRRREAARVFARVMGSPLPFELSIGEPLAAHAPVEFALTLLEFSFREIDFERASRLMRSPFLGGAEAEMAARARLDARLRRDAGVEISLPKMVSMADENLSLRLTFENLFRQVKEKEGKRLSPHDWARHFTALLEAAGFPGERGADSAEYQARAKFNELLGEFAGLGLVTSILSFQDAFKQLRRLCVEELFQPEGAGAPVQLLGLLESAGLEFDALWVSGLEDGKWPQQAHAHPFLPVALQRKAGIPEASAETSLALDRRRTEGWLQAADEVVLSWARREEDRELSPSPLIAQVPEGAVELPSFDSYRELIFSSGALESVNDEKAPPVSSMAIKGGTRVLADQAACPFRAFARHRLGAEALAAPEPGPDAMARGTLLHALMAEIWRELKTRDALAGDLSAVIARSAAKAVKELDIEGHFAELETRRLIRLAGEWLEVEKGREDFSVVAVERKAGISIAGLSFSGRIDRMDRLADGSHAIIDYKTGSRVSPNDWMGERPDEPQLPLYAVSAAEDVSAVAYAKLKTGDMKYAGLSLKEKAIPGVKPAKSWSGLMQYWKTELENLAAGYARGEARVAPKKGLATCRNCDLQPLCRVHERLSALAQEEEGE